MTATYKYFVLLPRLVFKFFFIDLYLTKMAFADFPLITNRVSACYFSSVSLNKDGQKKGKKNKIGQLQVKTTCIHGGLSDYTEYHIAQCSEFATVYHAHL